MITEEIRIEGTVCSIIYQNQDNGYAVCDIESEAEGLFTATGCMPYISEGESVALVGAWGEHPDYGTQFCVSYYESVLPTDEKAIIKYLSSGIVSGVGAATAKNLVAHFGTKTLEVMLNQPERLTEIKGISPKRAEKISASFLELQSIQGIIIFLQQFNITSATAMRVQQKLGSAAVEMIKENPYILADMVDGISFKKADEIAHFQGLPKNSPMRIKAGIRYFLTAAAYNSGHTYLPREELISETETRLGVKREEVEDAISGLMLIHSVFTEEFGGEKRCMLHSLYTAEHYIARRLATMSASEPKYVIEPEKIDRIIAEAEAEEQINLAKEQKQAVMTAVEKSCMVITGGPGTGKTTIIKTILKTMEEISQRVVLAAPTGRAAKRMSSVTGHEAKTIHRMLGVKSSDDTRTSFTHNEAEPLEADVIIVDEASMIDVQLMYALMLAIKPGAKLILCGDANQLPSVGPGNVLRDIIAAGVISVISLEHIFRQASESLIVVNAHRINRGEMPYLAAKDKDFFYINKRHFYEIRETIVSLYCFRLPNRYNQDPKTGIQILSPTKRGAAGTICLNHEIQGIVNPADITKNEYKYGTKLFRDGDKVMQIKNDYDIVWSRPNGEVGTGIYNGDMGVIESISQKDKLMTVIFDDDKEVEYPFSNLDRLELAYAVTVHKSQGSEFPIVIMPVCEFAPMLMYRNLLYTAVTRAKQMVILVGNADSIIKMVKNCDQHKRYTGLYDKLETIKKMITE